MGIYKFIKFNKSRLLHSAAVVFLFLFIAVTIVLLYYEFNIKLTNRFNSSTITTLSEASAQIVDTISLKSKAMFTTLESISLSYGNLDDPFSKDSLKLLEKQKYLNNFTSIGVVNRDGTVYYSNGQTEDISDQKYFQNALCGNNSVSQLNYSKISNNYTLTYAVPLIKKERIEGVLVCTFQNNYLADLVDLQIFGGRGMLFIMQSNGQILTRSNTTMLQKNFFDILAISSIDFNYSKAQMKDTINSRKKSIIKFTPIHKEPYYAYYEPLQISDWYLISMVPENFIIDQSSHISKLSLRLVVKALGLLILLFLIVVNILYQTFKKFAVMNRKFEALVSNVPGGMFCFSPLGNFEFDYISDGLLKIFGYTEEEFKEKFNNSFANSIYLKDRSRVLDLFQKKNETLPITQTEYRIECADGEIRWLLGRGQIIADECENPRCYVVVMDITHDKKILESLRLNEERYRIVVAQTESMIYEYSAQNGTLFHNSLLFKLKFGYPLVDDGFPKSFISNVHPEDVDVFLNLYSNCTVINPTNSAEVRIRKSDDCYVWCSVQNTTIFSEDGTPLRYIGGILDIDKRRRETESLKQLAQLDPLTALYNKTSIQSRIESCLENCEGNHALMFIDVDNFKSINDTLGHLFGDAILSELASNLQKLAGGQNLAGRVGGDEFVLFLKDCYDLDEICQRAEEVCSVFRNYAKDNNAIPISCSIGIALFPQDGISYEALTQKADSALYSAKSKGKNCFEFYFDGIKLVKRERTPSFSSISSTQKYNAHHFTSFIFDILYQTNDIGNTINFVLSLIGQHYRTSRIYIKEAYSDRNSSFLSYEWCNKGICSLSGQRNFLNSDVFCEIKRKLNTDGILFCDNAQQLNDLPTLQNHFIEDNLSNLLNCAILDNGILNGIVCFEQSNNDDIWNEYEKQSLALVGKILGSYLVKMRNRQIFQQQYSALQSAIDCQNTWLYVIDAETNRLLYMSRRVARDFPNATIGSVCYKSLDDSLPCTHCLANRMMLSDKTIYERYFSNRTNRWMLYTASRFLWPLGNKSAILITYRYADEIHDLTD